MKSRMIALVVAATGLATAGACSHEQSPSALASITATPLPPTPVVRTAAQRNEPSTRMARLAESSTDKDDDSIFFDFDSATLRNEAQPVLRDVAASFESQRTGKLRIEGNCDQLGTVEYNLALGEQRALAAKDYLAHLGVPRNRIATISYGSQHPKYPGTNEDDRQKNRRDDFVPY